MNMKRRLIRYASVILSLCLLLSLCACTPALPPEPSEQPVERAEIPQTEPDLRETDELVIWAFDVDCFERKYRPELTSWNELFAEQYPDVKVTVKYTSGTELGPNSDLRMWIRLKKDWGKETPDLIMLGNYPGHTAMTGNLTCEPGEGTYRDIYELIEAGKLLDLNPLLENDGEINLEDYDEKILSAGVYRGGRYLFPLSGGTCATTLLGTQEALDAVGFSPEAWENGVTLMEELARIQEQGDYKDVIVACWMYAGLEWTIFDACIPSLVDREAGVVTARREELRPFCQAWKKLFYDSGLDRDAATSMSDNYIGQATQKNKQLFEFVGSDDPYTVGGLAVDSTPVYRNFPSIDGKILGDISHGMAVCSEGKNQLNAWRYLKMMMSEQAQETPGLEEGAYPSLRSQQAGYTQDQLESAERSAASQYTFGKSVPLSDEQQEMCRAVIEDVDTYRIASPAEFAIFQEQMEPYFLGEEKYEDCIENLKAALRSYLAGE